MNPAANTGMSLSKKLGNKGGYTIKLLNEPEYYFNLFADFPDNVMATREKKGNKILYIILRPMPENLKRTSGV